MYKYRAEITKGEELRYISHLDYANVIVRAICRSHMPAAYSEGFNPHMKVAFASALSLGVTSDTECMDFELTKPLCQPEVFDRLSANLPKGVRLLRLKPVKEPPACYGKKHKALMAEVDMAEYEAFVPLLGEWDAAVKAVADFNAVKEAVFQRVTPKKHKEIEVKQYMKDQVRLGMSGDKLRLTMAIAITPTGSVKPGEVLKLMQEEFGLPISVEQALINRTSLTGSGKSLMDLV